MEVNYRAALSLVAPSCQEDNGPAVNSWTDATVLCPASLDYDPGDSCSLWPTSQFEFKNKIPAGHFFILQILKGVDIEHSRKLKKQEGSLCLSLLLEKCLMATVRRVLYTSVEGKEHPFLSIQESEYPTMPGLRSSLAHTSLIHTSARLSTCTKHTCIPM